MAYIADNFSLSLVLNPRSGLVSGIALLFLIVAIISSALNGKFAPSLFREMLVPMFYRWRRQLKDKNKDWILWDYWWSDPLFLQTTLDVLTVGCVVLLIVAAAYTHNGFLGSSAFFIGLTFLLGFHVVFSVAFDDFQIVYRSLYLAAGAMISTFSIFVLVQLLSQGAGQVYSFRATGALWMGISLIPLLYQPHQKNPAEATTTSTSFDAPPADAHAQAICAFPEPLSLSLSLLPATTLSSSPCVLALRSVLPDWVWRWSLSLLPILVFACYDAYHGSPLHNDAALWVLMTIIITEGLFQTLGNATNEHLLLVVHNRFLMVVVGSEFWLLGVVSATLCTSSLAFKSWLHQALPPPQSAHRSALMDRVLQTIQRKGAAAPGGSNNDDATSSSSTPSSSSSTQPVTSPAPLNPMSQLLRMPSVVIALLQVLVALSLATGSKGVTGLQLSMLTGMPQLAWAGCVWLLWLTCALFFVVYRIVHRNGLHLPLLEEGANVPRCSAANFLAVCCSCSCGQAFFGEVADSIKEGMDEKVAVGASVCLVWLLTTGSAVLASYLTTLWLMVPLVSLLPPAVGIFYNFLQGWEKAGCPALEAPAPAPAEGASAEASSASASPPTTTSGWSLRRALRSWQLALVLLVLGVGLACVPKKFFIMAIYLGLWMLAAALTAATVARWRCTLVVDRALLVFVAASWVPTVVWSVVVGGVNGKTLAASTVIMPLLAGTTLQIAVLSGWIWKDCMQMAPMAEAAVAAAAAQVGGSAKDDVENPSASASASARLTPPQPAAVTSSKTFLIALVATAGALVLIMFSLFTAYVSTPLGMALIMIFVPVLLVLAVRLDVLRRDHVCLRWVTEHSSLAAYGKRHQGLLLGLLISCLLLSGLLGALAHPSHAFWWASFSWLALALTSLIFGLADHWYARPKIYGALFYPVYAFSTLGSGNTALENVSLQSSWVLVFFIMLAVWAVWCSIIVIPAEGGVILFVISTTSAALYLRLVSAGSRQRGTFPDAAVLDKAKSVALTAVFGDVVEAAVELTKAPVPGAAAAAAAADAADASTPLATLVDAKIKQRLAERAAALEHVRQILAAQAGVYSPMSPVPFVNLFAFCTKKSEAALPKPAAGAATVAGGGKEPQFGSTAGGEKPVEGKRHSAIKGMTDNPLVSKGRESDLKDVALSNDLDPSARDSIPSFIDVAATTTDEKVFFELIDAHLGLVDRVASLNKFRAMYLLRAYADCDNALNAKVAGLLAFLRDQFKTLTCATQEASIQVRLSDTSGVDVGCAVSGPGIPDGTVVAALDRAQRLVTLSTQATATAPQVLLQFTSLFFCESAAFSDLTAEDREALKVLTPFDLLHSLPPALLQGLVAAYQSYQDRLERQEAQEREEKRRRDAEMRERELAKRARELAELEATRAKAKAKALEEELAREKAAAQAREAAHAAEIAAMKQRMEEIAHEDEQREAEEKAAAAAAIAQKEEEARRDKAEAERKRKEDEARLEAQRKKDAEEANRPKPAKTGGSSVVSRYGSELDDSLSAEVAKVLPRAGAKFVDAEFDMSSPAGLDDVLGSEELTERKFTAVRLGDLLGGDKIRALPDGGLLPAVPDPKNCKQGSLGDCFFISAVATVAERPALVKRLRLFPLGQQHMAIGLYAVGLHFNGKYRTVIVDDLVPCQSNGKTPAFASGLGCEGQPHHALWVMLLEKAYAKIHGTYAALEGGFESLAMEDITGGVPGSIDDLATDMDGMWERIRLLFEGGHLLGAGSTSGKDTETTSEGVIKGHAYSILQVRTADGHRLLQMRNPWGRGEWTGAWSDNAPEWTPRLRRLLGAEAKDDGKFWIALEDFVRVFRTVYLCRIFDNVLTTQGGGDDGPTGVEGADASAVLKFKEVRLEGPEYQWKKDSRGGTGSAGGCSNFSTFCQNPQFLLSCTEDCNVTLVLAQTEDLVGKSGKALQDERNGEKAMGISVFLNGGKKITGRGSGTEVEKTKSYSYTRDVSIDFKITANTPLTVVPALFNPGDENAFTLKVLFQITNADTQVSLRGL